MDNIEKNESMPEESSDTKDIDTAVDEVLGKTKKSKLKWALLGIIAVIVVAALGIIVIVSNVMKNQEVSVALVNDESISQTDFDSFYVQQEPAYQSQGIDTTDPEQLKQAKVRALDALINQTLLLQAAAAADISISDEQVQSEYDKTVAQFDTDEALQSALVESNLTVDSLMSNIKTQLIIQQYLQTQVDDNVTASDEEIQALYDQYVAQGSNIPALTEVTTQLADQIKQQKMNDQVGIIIDDLRQSATIQTFLE